MFCNILSFYSEELLAPCPTAKLEDHPLSTAFNCLFNVFAAILHIWRLFLHSQPEDMPWCGDRDPLINIYMQIRSSGQYFRSDSKKHKYTTYSSYVPAA